MKIRKKRRYRGRKQNSGMKFLGFIGIIISAVICGYLTARFVVAPLLGYETEVLKLDFSSKLTAAAENLKDTELEEATESKEEETKEEGYVLQFGVFSNEAGAEELVQSLKKKDIETEIKEIQGQYKVLSGTFETKEAALKELEALKDKENIDVFITVTDL